jgi:Pro-kumamolisin, activation domain/FG-GAP-like repeat/Subtilase family
MQARYCTWLVACGLVLVGGMPAVQATAARVSPNIPMATETPLITAGVDNTKLVSVRGSVMPAAVSKYDTGAVSTSRQLNHMTLLLKRSPDRQARFESYLTQLTTPHSPYFHKWLTPQELGDKFGPSKQDIAKVTQWLTSQGLRVGNVSKSGMRVTFSGSVASVQSAFHTQLHNYNVNGESHFANASEQQIPEALSSVVVGVSSLNNFFPKSQMRAVGTDKKDVNGHWTQVATAPGFTNPPVTEDPKSQYDVVPADFNTIYNVNPLWAGTVTASNPTGTPIRGAGVTIAVLERSAVNPADIASFRAQFLPADATGTVSYASVDSGDGSCVAPGKTPDEGEAALDAEWAGAAAPDANIIFAACADSDTDFGPFIAARSLLDADVPAIMSLSYGGCEAAQGPGEGEVLTLWSEAVAHGATVFVSTGDAGAAGCDQNLAAASFGLAVNGLATTPYNVAVGGTDFYDVGKTASYWNATNDPVTGGSAIGYIPEQTWNDSCASSVLFTLEGTKGHPGTADGETFCNTSFAQQHFLTTGGGSGGASADFLKPTWQVGVFGGVKENVRTIPDVSLFAANGVYGHALLFCDSDGGGSCDFTQAENVYAGSAGGTSFAAPAMAGVQALVNQATSIALGGSSLGLTTGLGNVNPALYLFGTRQYGTAGSPNPSAANCNSATTPLAGNSCVFNDVTIGDIDTPCYAGTNSCYTRGLDAYGVLSLGGNQSLKPAYLASAGYDLATGLGSVNVANLANAMANYYSDYSEANEFLPFAPSDFLGNGNDIQFPFGSIGNVVDGRTDIATINPTTGSLTELGMVGGTEQQTATTTGFLPGYTIQAIGDFNNDGISDFALTNPATNEVYLWINDGLGHGVSYDAGSYPSGWTIVGAARVDNFQIQLVWRNNATAQVGWWTFGQFVPGQNGARNTVSHSISALLPAATGYTLTLASVTGSDQADFVWTGPSNDLYIWNNDGGPLGGRFTPHFIGNYPSGWTLQGAGDINGDGFSDLLWTNTSTNQFGWWIMNGDTVADREARTITPGYSIATIGDFNGDGLVDILWTNAAGNAYLWTSIGSTFQSFGLSDQAGTVVTIPAGSKVAANRLQGGPTGNFFNGGF